MNNLVKLFNNFGEELEVRHSTFPAGEVYVKIVDTSKITNSMTVGLYDASSDSIMRAIMLASACDSSYLILNTTYMPYSRQDRVCSEGETDSFFEFQFILGEFFDEIVTVDLHNPLVASSTTTNLKPDYSKLLSVRHKEAITTIVDSYSLVVAPDKGAIKRASDFAIEFDCEVTSMSKTRTTSCITQSVDEPEVMVKATNIIIVDDICDGGATFLAAAMEIRKYNKQANLYLIVSHGIFSAGTERLLEMFEDVLMLDNQYNRNRLCNLLM